MKKVIVLLALLIYNLHGSAHAMQMQDDDDDQFSLLPLPGMQEAELSPEEQAAQAAGVQEVGPSPEEQAAQAAGVQEVGPSPEEQAAQAAGVQEVGPSPEEQATQAAGAQEAEPIPEGQAIPAPAVQAVEQYPQEQAAQDLPAAPAEAEAPTAPVGPEIKPTQFKTLELEKSENLIKSSNRKIYELYEQASTANKEIDEVLNSLSITQKNLYDDYYQATDSLDLFYQKTSFIKGQFGTKKK